MKIAVEELYKQLLLLITILLLYSFHAEVQNRLKIFPICGNISQLHCTSTVNIFYMLYSIAAY